MSSPQSPDVSQSRCKLADDDDGAPIGQPANGHVKTCCNCGTTETPMWRGEHCNACAIWKRKHGDERPLEEEARRRAAMPPARPKPTPHVERRALPRKTQGHAHVLLDVPIKGEEGEDAGGARTSPLQALWDAVNDAAANHSAKSRARRRPHRTRGCCNCGTTETPVCRGEHCNACAMWKRKHGGGERPLDMPPAQHKLRESPQAHGDCKQELSKACADRSSDAWRYSATPGAEGWHDDRLDPP